LESILTLQHFRDIPAVLLGLVCLRFFSVSSCNHRQTRRWRDQIIPALVTPCAKKK